MRLINLPPRSLKGPARAPGTAHLHLGDSLRNLLHLLLWHLAIEKRCPPHPTSPHLTPPHPTSSHLTPPHPSLMVEYNPNPFSDTKVLDSHARDDLASSVSGVPGNRSQEKTTQGVSPATEPPHLAEPQKDLPIRRKSECIPVGTALTQTSAQKLTKTNKTS